MWLLQWKKRKGIEKKKIPVGLVDFQIPVDLRPRHRQDAGKQFLTNLIYMVQLPKVLKMIIPFYWNPGKTIIDVTAGEKISWRHFPYNHRSPCGFEHWHVEFNDIEPSVEAEYHVAAQEIHKKGHWDILFNDFPFIELKNGVESFGVRAKKIAGRSMGDIARSMSRSRKFYFRGFRPLKELFPECVEAFNKASDNMIIKIGNSHKEGVQIDNVTDAILAFDKTRNPKSEFNFIDAVGYRGNYARRGGRFRFAQSVMSYYLIFKKDPLSR